MYARLFFLSAAALGLMSAQTFERRASFKYGGDANHGKCTIVVVVDGAADVEIRGDSALLRNLGGQPPQWRRYECTGPLPANPAGFRLSPQDGRGRQQLIRDPRDGGVAVVRIEDPDSGHDTYKFDLLWNGAYPSPAETYRAYDRGADRRFDPDGDGRGDPDRRFDRDRDGRDLDAYHRDRDDSFRGEDWRQRFFQRIRQDLYHVQSVTFAFGGDQYRISRTLEELDELQGKLARGRYDEGELNEVIEAMQKVVRDNRLQPRDREMLADDLDRMRDFRSRHEYYGAR